jgi:1-acyl-sn-glycerol-3-phosphate acyltransferase
VRAASPERLARRLASAERPTLRRSPAMHAFMVHYFERFFRRHMNALRLAQWGRLDARSAQGPVIVYSNHPAWWDAVVYVLGAAKLMPERESYAPIDAEMLAKYGVLGRIGAFGVDLDSPRGAAAFLAAAADVLSRPDRALWITAQGRFADVRQRPLGLKAGVARLPEIAPDALVVPLAIEYAFWLERGAEACLAFGAPMRGADLAALPRDERRERLEQALTETLDRLSDDVAARDPARFTAVLEGHAGTGGVYALWKRAAAALRGRFFDPAHAGPR